MDEKAAPKTTAPTIRYVDLPDVREVFADSIINLVYEGQTLRIEFGVTRLDEVRPDTPMSAHRYPACRLVLSPSGAADLINRMQQIVANLTEAGVLKARQNAAP